MSLKLPIPQGLSFLRSVGWFEERKADAAAARQRHSPRLKLQTDREVYRPGDSVTATIEICTPAGLKDDAASAESGEDAPSLLVDGLSFEIKGIEKLDSQWFSVPKPLPGSKQRRGEHLFLDCSAPSLIPKVIIASGQTKTCPKCLILAQYQTHILEARVPLQICVSQKSSNLLNEEADHVVPVPVNFPLPIEQPDIFWREKDEDSEWSKANDNTDLEEGYDSSKDEVSSVSSYNKANPESSLRSSVSMHSLSSRLSTSEPLYSRERPSFPSYSPIPRLSVSEISDDHGGGVVSPQRKLNHLLSDHHPSNGQMFSLDPDRSNDDAGPPLTPKYVEPAGSEGFMRGRSYNIRIDDQVLLRFSPKNSDSTYYFGDMIGGALTFFHGSGTRRCLEVSVTLETSETVNPRVIHPSRRSSSSITKVHSEHYEVVADLHQTSFLFSVPIDGPMSFSTSKVSVQWSLRFEFFTTPEGIDSSRYEHPLLVEKREKGDWVLPITVYAPPLRRQAIHGRNDRSVLVGNLFNS
uniref:Uncharacterized protein n=1 Tax=Oryza glumipatula TaxID=40148 RepID=A0A0E0ABX4_9ORYZ